MITNPFEILKHQRFIKEQSIGLDFTEQSPISVVEFYPFAPRTKGSLEHLVKTFTNKFNVNFVAIATGRPKKDTPFSTFNLNGLIDFDVWEDPYLIGKLLYHLLITVHKSKYIIFTGDCGGAYTAILSSLYVPINVLLCTTPFISFKDMYPYGFTNPENITSYDHRIWLKEKFVKKNYNELSDLFPQLVKLKNSGIKIDLHWSKYPSKTDIYEVNRALSLEKSLNFSIHLHDSPPSIHPHLIGSWFKQTSIIDSWIKKEIALAEIFLKSKVQ